MERLRFRTIIPKSRHVEIDLPPGVPEGPADVLVVVEPRQPPPSADGLREILAELASFRKRFDGREIRLSEAVIEERREGA